MKTAISIEWLKIKRLVSVKVILAIYMLIVPLWLYFLGEFFNTMKLPFFPKPEELWSFPLIWKFNTYCASYFNVLVGVIIVILTTNEFSNKTFRQGIIEGLSKKELIFSKFFSIVWLSATVTLYTAIVTIIFGLINSKEIDIYTNIHFIFIYFLQTLCYFSFAFFLAVLIKLPAVTIIVFTLSFLVETIVGAFLPKMVYLYFPLNVFSKLTPIPFFDSFIKMAEEQSKEKVPHMELYEVILFALLYMSVFFWIAYYSLKKKDI